MANLQQRVQTIKAKLVEIVKGNPGIPGTSSMIPVSYRKYLRSLEYTGELVYNGGWHVTDKQND